MKILSIDIGSHAIKISVLETSFGKLELSDYLTEILPKETLPTEPKNSDDETPKPLEKQRFILTDAQLLTIKKIITEAGLTYDKLILNIPKNLVTTRLLTFPTKDKKTIIKSVGFELEDELPIDIEQVVYDLAILPGSTGNQSTAFVSIAMKRDLVLLLSQLQEISLDPDYISTEGWALSNVISKTVPADLAAAPICVINMGANQTSFHIVISGKPVLSHTVNAGGNKITEAIATHYGLSFEEAEQAKIDGAFLLTKAHLQNPVESQNLTEDQKLFSKIISDAILPLVREIRQSLMSFKSQYHFFPKVIYLTGGSSLIPNMGMYLEEIVEIPVVNLQYSAQVTGTAVQLADSTEAAFSTAIGLASCVYKPDKNTILNFRKDVFQKRSGLVGFNFETFRTPLKYLAASLAFIYANLAIQYMVLSHSAKKVEASVERSIKSVLGTASRSNIATYINSPSILKNTVNKEIQKYKPQTVEPPVKQVSAFDVLHKFSTLLPRDIILDVSEFKIENGAVKVAGLINQQTDVDRVTKFLEETKLISELTKGAATLDAESKRYKFQITGKLLTEKK